MRRSPPCAASSPGLLRQRCERRGVDCSVRPRGVRVAFYSKKVKEKFGSKVGKHCIINAFANIGHDAVVEDYAFVGGGAMLAGFSEIGEGAILGMGAIVAPKVRVGPWSTVMITSAVVADVPASTACGGVPGVSFGRTERTKVGERTNQDTRVGWASS